MAAFFAEQTTQPQTLCDWVKNFRIKKVQMKRKLRSGGDLRVCAILSRALISAEQELRRKQQERFSRWLELQNKFVQKTAEEDEDVGYIPNNESYHYQQRHHNEIGNGVISMSQEEVNRRKEITDLWKYELSGLDSFMKNISNNNQDLHHQQPQPCVVQS
ncbi:hypothetical protein ACFFRR_006004 [Megaselia abdita]